MCRYCADRMKKFPLFDHVVPGFQARTHRSPVIIFQADVRAGNSRIKVSLVRRPKVTFIAIATGLITGLPPGGINNQLSRIFLSGQHDRRGSGLFDNHIAFTDGPVICTGIVIVTLRPGTDGYETTGKGRHNCAYRHCDADIHAAGLMIKMPTPVIEGFTFEFDAVMRPWQFLDRRAPLLRSIRRRVLWSTRRTDRCVARSPHRGAPGPGGNARGRPDGTGRGGTTGTVCSGHYQIAR